MTSSANGNDKRSRWDKRWWEIRRMLEGRLEDDLEEGDIILHQVVFSLKGYEALVIAKATGKDGGKIVSFTSGPDLEGALWAFVRGVQGDTLKWRTDKPWKPKADKK